MNDYEYDRWNDEDRRQQIIRDIQANWRREVEEEERRRKDSAWRIVALLLAAFLASVLWLAR